MRSDSTIHAHFKDCATQAIVSAEGSGGTAICCINLTLDLVVNRRWFWPPREEP